jgi:hypothetical protein
MPSCAPAVKARLIELLLFKPIGLMLFYTGADIVGSLREMDGAAAGWASR